MHRSGLVLLSIVGSVALAIGCSGGDDGGTGGQSTGDQASDDVDDEVEIPDFQIEPAPGARRANLVDEGQLQLDYAEADFDRVVAFYDDWTAEDDGTWERFEGADGSVGWKNGEARGPGFRAISVAVIDLGGNEQQLTIAVLIAD